MKLLPEKALRMSVIVISTTTFMFILFFASVVIFTDYKFGIDEYIKDKNYLAEMDKRIEQNPEDYMAYIALSNFYLGRDETEKALQFLNKAVEVKPDEDWVYRFRGWRYRIMWRSKKFESSPKKQEYLDLAMQDMNKAIELSDEVIDYDLKMRADLYMGNGKYNEAIADLDRVLEIPSSSYLNYDCYLERGKAYLALKEYDRALTDLDKSLKLIPVLYEQSERAETYFGLAKAFEDEGRIPEAMQAYKGFLAQEKGKAWALDNQDKLKEVREKIITLGKMLEDT